MPANPLSIYMDSYRTRSPWHFPAGVTRSHRHFCHSSHVCSCTVVFCTLSAICFSCGSLAQMLKIPSARFPTFSFICFAALEQESAKFWSRGARTSRPLARVELFPECLERTLFCFREDAFSRWCLLSSSGGQFGCRPSFLSASGS